ncbi:hypothetical protein N792_11745 [Lysobacter concretionis Ko07 = DSM 16239]|uniref:Uncharacterized protein n=1 Tax=Lysobacter concretionis Ko07 = DSM 16239 TaxID=1122185 RepID=A0A0A0EQG8_9GAMM|nr:hypothetical protein N792_11745 [Lysobacter concretionis Ko07 = DSM 16239]
MGEAGAVALRAGFAGFPGRLQGMAGGGALGVDTAVGGDADFALQGHAAGGAVAGAAHDDAVGVEFFGQFGRGGAAQEGVGFGPVEGDAEVGAAGAAAEAGVVRHRRWPAGWRRLRPRGPPSFARWKGLSFSAIGGVSDLCRSCVSCDLIISAEPVEIQDCRNGGMWVPKMMEAAMQVLALCVRG